MITAEQAQALLIGTTPGPWEAEHRGYDVYETQTDHGDVVAEAGLRISDTRLIAAAPDLAQTVITLTEQLAAAEQERDDYKATIRANSRFSRAMFDVIGDVPEVQAAHARLDADPYSQDGTDFGSIVSAYVIRLRAELAAAEARAERVRAVRALHFANGRNILGYPVCDACTPLQSMPCPTIRALADPEPSPDGTRD